MGELLKLPYQFTVHLGDLVKMPNGVEGVVRFVDLVERSGKASKIVFVEPHVVWYKRWWMHFTNQLWFYDKEINKLIFVSRSN